MKGKPNPANKIQNVITLPVPPSNNTYKRHYCAVDPSHRIAAYRPDRTNQYMHDAGYLTKDVWKGGPQTDPFGITVGYFPAPGKPPLDTDNVLKVLLDTLTGIIWEDDKQVTDIAIFRNKPDPKKHPNGAVVLIVYPLQASK